MMATPTKMKIYYPPRYADLPTEILWHIYRYLNHADLQAAAATCTRWREAIHTPEFHENTVVRFAKVFLSDSTPPALDLMRSQRPFRRLVMEELGFGPVFKMMTHMGNSIEHVTFDNVDWGDKQFYAILEKLPKLRSLAITRCPQLFMSGSLLTNNDDRRMVTAALFKVKHLNLSFNQYLSDAILLRLSTLIDGLDTIDMTGCHIAYHNAIHRRFYPGSDSIPPSESILTFKFLKRVLLHHRLTLRELNLSHTMASGPAVQLLNEKDDGGLDLTRLRLAGCHQLNASGINDFLATQPGLVLLDLSSINCVNDAVIQNIIDCNTLLQEVNVSGCTNITNVGAQSLGQLKHLRCLNISHCDGIVDEGLMGGIANGPNPKMRELRMSHLTVGNECVRSVAASMTELRILDVSHCLNGVSDETVQCIIEHCRWLRELYLDDCFWVSDTALTGIDVSGFKLNPADAYTPSFPYSGKRHDPFTCNLQSMKFALCSRAETEIIRDALRKQALYTAFESNEVNGDEKQGHSIDELQGLKVLSLKGCNKVSDVSLKYGFKLKELRRLCLSRCQQVTMVGIDFMVASCPSLEEIDLTDCHNITDRAIQFLTSKLPRLRALHLSGCSQLTDHSLDAILSNCKCLHTLSLYRCRSMYTEIEDRCSVLPTLRNVLVDNMTVENAEIYRVKKRLDY